jgi:uncharacterized membrane protein
MSEMFSTKRSHFYPQCIAACMYTLGAFSTKVAAYIFQQIGVENNLHKKLDTTVSSFLGCVMLSTSTIVL